MIYWVPAVIIIYAGLAWLSQRNADGGWWWLPLTLYSMTFCNAWVLVSRLSRNLLLDGLVYDVAMMLGFTATLIYLGAAKQFNLVQCIGLVVVIIGILLMKISGQGAG